MGREAGKPERCEPLHLLAVTEHRPCREQARLNGSSRTNVRRGEIFALEQERRVERPGERIGGAVAKVEPRLRMDALAEVAVCLQSRRGLLAIKRHDLGAKLGQQGRQLIEPRLSRPAENHDADFLEGDG
jgi:hypothetical protein